MGKRLAFGTSGLRGPMGAGYGRMNDLVIVQVGHLRRLRSGFPTPCWQHRELISVPWRNLFFL